MVVACVEQPGVDASRLLAMGHSLGGKMAFCTGALDARVKCVIGSDFGLPWRSTNWDAPWYLGGRVPCDDRGMAHHELLALLAPRPFFLIAGETDARESWQYLEAARDVYRLYSVWTHIGGINHASGQAPSIAALRWLMPGWERFLICRIGFGVSDSSFQQGGSPILLRQYRVDEELFFFP